MKVFNVLLGFGLVSQSEAVNSAEQKFKHLNKVYPQMLELFFEDGGAENTKVHILKHDHLRSETNSKNNSQL